VEQGLGLRRGGGGVAPGAGEGWRMSCVESIIVKKTLIGGCSDTWSLHTWSLESKAECQMLSLHVIDDTAGYTRAVMGRIKGQPRSGNEGL
jgi:hypothetical protein